MTTSPKEIIRKNIRHALNEKTRAAQPVADPTHPLLPAVNGQTFLEQFRKGGGQCKICTRENFMQYLLKFLEAKKYRHIFNNCPSLSTYLHQNEVAFQEVLSPSAQPEIAIALADNLIVRSGSLVFSQQYTRYASVRNIAPVLLAIGFVSNMVMDLKDVLDNCGADSQKKTGMLEVITPTLPDMVDGQPAYTPAHPQVLLLLVEN